MVSLTGNLFKRKGCYEDKNSGEYKCRQILKIDNLQDYNGDSVLSV